MAELIWPLTLPTSPLVNGYAESIPDNLIRSSMSAGPAKVRRRSISMPWTFSATFSFTQTQLATFKTFFSDVIMHGALRFTFNLPSDGTSIECRIVTSQNMAISQACPGQWHVTLTFEVLP